MTGLLVAEMVATSGKGRGGAIIREICSPRLLLLLLPLGRTFRLTQERKTAFTEKLKTDPTELSGRKVTGVARPPGTVTSLPTALE